MLRTSMALLAGSLLVGCTVGDPGTGGDDDDTGGGAVCGDGLKASTEACDDSNTTGGDGCSATCTVEANPSLTASVDKATITTELGKTEMITLTLKSVDGFTGAVQVAPAFAVGTTPITGLTAQGPTSINVAAGATVPTQYTIAIPANFTGADVSATLKFGLTSSVGPKDVSSNLAVAASLTTSYAAGTAGTVAMHPGTGKTITVKRGAKLRFTNLDTATHITHGGGAFPHEDTTTGGTPTNTYEVNTIGTAVGSTGTLGCHSHGTATYATFTVE
jgi:cysteine-rich repeat protein